MQQEVHLSDSTGFTFATMSFSGNLKACEEYCRVAKIMLGCEEHEFELDCTVENKVIYRIQDKKGKW
jgi:hypothetical protein